MNEYQTIIDTVIRERDELKEHCFRLQGLLENTGFPPGHFYSPVVDVHEPQAAQAARDRLKAPALDGVAFDSTRILETLRILAEHHKKFPFPREPDAKYRFYLDNPYFGAHDASALFSMILLHRPKRIIEVGCGYSSCLLLDTNEIFFNGSIELILIDPYLEDLQKHFGPKGAPGAHLHYQKLQDVPLKIFAELEPNDILFIDSSHVAKTGSDVNHYLFRIFPLLKPGVIIHVHDILWPFEYAESWVLEDKRSWNEAYILHAFLQFNPSFEIVYWCDFVINNLRDELRALMPICMENGGGSIWFRRIG
jgi:predicted O-methyltransferase YrrM